MAFSLKFDADQFYNDLVNHLLTVMDGINQQFFKEATNGLSAKGKADSDIEKAVVEDSSDFDSATGTKFINARCKFYAEAIMESFGTGSKSDTSEKSYWEEYKATANSSPAFFNPLRTGTTIVGRPRGSYIDIYGNQKSTWGNMAGKPIEFLFEDKIKSPTYSIQHAEDWFVREGYSRKIEGKIEEAILEFIKENANNYFYLASG